jgi:methyl-accepting chemotaxis protein
MDAPPERLIDAFADEPEAEGLILTRRGVYAGLLPAMALLQLAARREQEAHRLKLAHAEAVVARGQALQLAFDRFQQDARRFGDALVATAADIKASASDTADQAGLNGAQAAAVAAASEQSTRGIKEIADSSGALAIQARSIDGQVRQVKAAVLAVVGEVAASEGKSRSLSAAADEIGDVVDLISGIARRVNMLSINATIEAARAGPAGKGFAVVAGEIKSLAGQAGKATGQIAGRIEAIRLAVAESGEANRRIGGIVEGLDGVAVAISAAVGRQSQASDIIAGSVQQAAEASAEISGHVAELGDRASDAHRLSLRMRDVADALTATAERLRLRVDDFLGEIGAA